MRNLKSKTLGAAIVGAVLTCASVAHAVPTDYQFTFTGSVNDGFPTITGIVRGLEEGDSSIDTVEILSNSQGYGIGTYTHNDFRFGDALWTVTAGDVTDWNFLSFGSLNSAPDVTDSSLLLTAELIGITNGENSGLTENPFNVLFGGSSRAVFEVVAPVPLPASVLLLGAGVMGLSLTGYRRRRAA